MFKNMPRQTFGRVQSKLFPMCVLDPGGTVGLLLCTLGKTF